LEPGCQTHFGAIHIPNFANLLNYFTDVHKISMRHFNDVSRNADYDCAV